MSKVKCAYVEYVGLDIQIYDYVHILLKENIWPVVTRKGCNRKYLHIKRASKAVYEWLNTKQSEWSDCGLESTQQS